MIWLPPRCTLFPYTTLFRSDEIFVIGGSFSGAAAILASLDPRVTKVIANCPVVDWSILDEEQKDRKSTRLNSSHANISYAVFCLKKKKRHATGASITTSIGR